MLTFLIRRLPHRHCWTDRCDPPLCVICWRKPKDWRA